MFVDDLAHTMSPNGPAYGIFNAKRNKHLTTLNAEFGHCYRVVQYHERCEASNTKWVDALDEMTIRQVH